MTDKVRKSLKDQVASAFRFKSGTSQYLQPKDEFYFAPDDDQFLLCDPADPTKCIRLDAGAVTTGTTRVISFPDADLGFGSGTGGILPADQYVYQSASFTLGNVNTAQAMFTAAHDTFTVAAATTYRMELLARLTTGATTHTTAFGLLGAGATTTFTSVHLEAFVTSTADAGVAASTQSAILVSTAQVLNATSTAVKTGLYIVGTFQTNAAGTIIPSITFSADPTGTCTTDVGSYCRISVIGSNTFTGTAGWS